MVVRPRWPGEDTTPSASRDDASDAVAYSSADEASQPWPGLLTYPCIAVQLGRISKPREVAGQFHVYSRSLAVSRGWAFQKILEDCCGRQRVIMIMVYVESVVV